MEENTKSNSKTTSAEKKVVKEKKVAVPKAKKVVAKPKATKPVVKKALPSKKDATKTTKEAIVKKADVISENKTEAVTTAPTKSKLELIHEKCTSLGIPFTDIHTEEDLQRLILMIEPSATPIIEVPNNASVELNLDNIDAVSEKAPETEVKEVKEEPAPFVHVEATPIAITSNLDGFREMFLATINGHFRMMSFEDIQDLFKGGAYPFSYNINRNSSNPNQVEIIFKNEVETVRLPSEDKNSWIAIS